ncbi:hypothetical protein HY734_01160 [Candidatus Uhrbacteria bacterium]|nr:hypothetical protein [Candidatus Uhrbacteria bacterium]
MRYLSLLALALLAVLPLNVRAATPADDYADVVYQASNEAYQPEAALGAPNEEYAQFFDLNASVILDFGEGEDGTGDLTLYYQVLDFGAGYRVEFLNAKLERLQTSAALLDVTTSKTTILYAGTEAYRYVEVVSVEDEVWKLDAVEAADHVEAKASEPTVSDPASSSDEADTVPDEEEEKEEPSTQGLLVKLPDDGDPTTQADSAVYAIGKDGMRHAFPSETVFRSWWQDFDDVALIDPENLAKYPLGANVTMRPGSHLLKLVSDPKVYAVEPGGVLRWVSSEEAAKGLYGEAWMERVVDLPDAYFGNYQMGESLGVSHVPAGSIGYIQSSGQVVYVDVNTYYGVPGDVYAWTAFQKAFHVSIMSAWLDGYTYGGDLKEDPDVRFPF